MITKIAMNNVASYKSLTTLETDKTVNLIYGLNGTGKSTLSSFLYNKDDSKFNDCSINSLIDEDIRVYSQKFIQDYFYESDNLKGIFTLSRKNKEAEETIKTAEKKIKDLKDDETKINQQKNKQIISLETKRQKTENKTWEIKTTFAGGDRVLEYCLEKLKRKDLLFDHLANIKKPDEQPEKTIDQLKKEVEAIQGDDAQKYDLLSTINFTAHEVEQNRILQKNIVGNENSTISALINKLQNSDWVKDGLQYLPEVIKKGTESCPFCQSKTITNALRENIQNFFDESYENDINELNNLLSAYESAYEEAVLAPPIKGKFEANPYLVEKNSEFENYYNAVYHLLEKNINELKIKIKAPSQKIIFLDSTDAIKEFNDFIGKINQSIRTHNKKIDNKDDTLDEIKEQFWALMRWNYDQTISTYLEDKEDIEKKIGDMTIKKQEAQDFINKQVSIIIKQQENTINIEQSIKFINNGLVGLGLDDFYIEKHLDNFYKIKRSEQDTDIFHSLSEGEKMIISFLYFVETCRGKQSVSDTGGKKDRCY